MRLARHPRLNAAYIHYMLNGITHGFHPGIPLHAEPRSCQRNHPMDLHSKIATTEDILEGLDKGFTIGPFSPDDPIAADWTFSPLGAVWKPGRPKVRLIMDMSCFKRLLLSVNTFIAAEYKYVSYLRTRQVVAFVNALGKDAWLWLADMDQAYRRVHVQREHWKFLAFRWFGYVYATTCLPFGMASSCQLYCHFANAVRYIAIGLYPGAFQFHGCDALFSYMDDFFGGAQSKADAQTQFDLFLALIAWLGIPTQPRKCQSPAQIQSILGFLYNSITRTVSVPPKKYILMCEELQRTLALASLGRLFSRRQLAQIIGKLMWASQVIFPARAFIRRLELASNIPQPWDKACIRLTPVLCADLQWWLDILPSARNGISFDYLLRPHNQGDIHVWTDATSDPTLGFAGYSSLGHYFQITWKELNIPQATASHIEYQELLAICVAAHIWRDTFKNKSVTFWCDNEAVHYMLIKRSCTASRLDLLALIGDFCLCAFDWRFYYYMEWLSTDDNIEADYLSRFKPRPFARMLLPNAASLPGLKPFFSRFQGIPDSSLFIDDSAAALTAGRRSVYLSLPLYS